MAVMKAGRLLRDAADGQVTTIEARQGMKVDILAQQPHWVQIRLVELPAPHPVGWVVIEAVDTTSNALGAVDKPSVAKECVEAAAKFGNNAFYTMSVAGMRTNIVQPDAAGGTAGIFAFTPLEWKNTADQSEWAVKYTDADMSDWRAQVTLFSILAMEMQNKIAGLLQRQPSMVELLLAQTVGSAAAAELIANPGRLIADVLSAIVASDVAAEGINPANFTARDTDLLLPADTAADGTRVIGAIRTKLGAAFEDTRQLVRTQVEAFLAVAKQFGGVNPAQITDVNIAAAGVPADRGEMAELITKQFAAAGYGRIQQVAAVANAIAESNLDPKAGNTAGESSFGLFQLNRNGGVGTGYSPEELCIPEKNIEIMLGEIAKPYLSKARARFSATNDIGQAVDIFVRWFERPANQSAEVVKRTGIAMKLIQPLP